MLSTIKSFAAIILFACATLVVTPASAASINWMPFGSAAFKQSKESGKPVYVFGMSETCPWCHKMQTMTFTDQALIKLINSKFVPVKLDVDANPEIANRYGIIGIPTILILNSRGGVSSTIEGYKTASEMISALE